MPITAKELARLFSAEFKFYRNINPFLFEEIASNIPDKDRDDPDATEELEKLLERVAASLNSAHHTW